MGFSERTGLMWAMAGISVTGTALLGSVQACDDVRRGPRRTVCDVLSYTLLLGIPITSLTLGIAAHDQEWRPDVAFSYYNTQVAGVASLAAFHAITDGEWWLTGLLGGVIAGAMLTYTILRRDALLRNESTQAAAHFMTWGPSLFLPPAFFAGIGDGAAAQLILGLGTLLVYAIAIPWIEIQASRD